MKKMIWFTKEQVELLKDLKDKTGLNNSEVVRKAMEVYASVVLTKTGK